MAGRPVSLLWATTTRGNTVPRTCPVRATHLGADRNQGSSAWFRLPSACALPPRCSFWVLSDRLLAKVGVFITLLAHISPPNLRQERIGGLAKLVCRKEDRLFAQATPSATTLWSRLFRDLASKINGLRKNSPGKVGSSGRSFSRCLEHSPTA